jgi:ribosomal protein S18 acetylase RimI-like enzyme
VNVASWRETYAHILSPGFLAALDVDAVAERYARGIQSPTSAFVALEVDGEIRGYAAGGAPLSEDTPRDLELYMLYQLSSEHGSGSGQALLDALLGDRPAFLWVAEENPRAIAFYRRNGFEPDGAREVAESWEQLAEIRMVR